MNGAASYLLTVTSAAILAALLLTLAGRGHTAGLVKLLAGIFMAVTVVSPLLKVELPDLEAWFRDYSLDGTAAASWGEEMANDARQEIIKERLETYILDKAAQLGAVLEAEVSVDKSGMPVHVALTGEISPAVRKQLIRIIENDLGLGEEAQQWNS